MRITAYDLDETARWCEENNLEFDRRNPSWARRCKLHFLNDDELRVLMKVSPESDFIFAMDELKHNDIIEFNLKMSQFKQGSSNSTQPTTNTTKCPTCGSTNVKKISGGKRWVTTGLFGLASSNVGKTMQCDSCGAKW